MKPLAVALLLSCAHAAALAQEVIRFNPAEPFNPIVARWASKEAKFTSETSDPDYMNRITKWSGNIYGVIKSTGHVVLKAENGCILSGFASPFTASTVLWSFTGKLEGCAVIHFNQTVTGNLRLDGGELTIEVREPPFAVGRPPVHYKAIATMRRY